MPEVAQTCRPLVHVLNVERQLAEQVVIKQGNHLTCHTVNGTREEQIQKCTCCQQVFLILVSTEFGVVEQPRVNQVRYTGSIDHKEVNKMLHMLLVLLLLLIA